jgi:hypothetical protein
MLVLTKDLEFDRGRAERDRRVVSKALVNGWSSDDGKAIIKVNAWR